MRSILMTRCDGQGAVPQAGAVVPPAQPAVYAGARQSLEPRAAGANLYAFAPDSGAVRWCVQFTLQFTLPETDTRPPRHGPLPPPALVGIPLVADGVVYTCVSGGDSMLYAFNAADGALLDMKRVT